MWRRGRSCWRSGACHACDRAACLPVRQLAVCGVRNPRGSGAHGTRTPTTPHGPATVRTRFVRSARTGSSTPTGSSSSTAAASAPVSLPLAMSLPSSFLSILRGTVQYSTVQYSTLSTRRRVVSFYRVPPCAHHTPQSFVLFDDRSVVLCTVLCTCTVRLCTVAVMYWVFTTTSRLLVHVQLYRYCMCCINCPPFPFSLFSVVPRRARAVAAPRGAAVGVPGRTYITVRRYVPVGNTSAPGKTTDVSSS